MAYPPTAKITRMISIAVQPSSTASERGRLRIMHIGAGTEESMGDHFLRGDTYQRSRMYPDVEGVSLSYSEVGNIRNR